VPDKVDEIPDDDHFELMWAPIIRTLFPDDTDVTMTSAQFRAVCRNLFDIGVQVGQHVAKDPRFETNTAIMQRMMGRAKELQAEGKLVSGFGIAKLKVPGPKLELRQEQSYQVEKNDDSYEMDVIKERLRQANRKSKHPRKNND